MHIKASSKGVQLLHLSEDLSSRRCLICIGDQQTHHAVTEKPGVHMH